MKALINPNELRKEGYRVCETHQTGFDVSEPLFWVDCDDTIFADQFWFDFIDNSFKVLISTTTELPTIDQQTIEGTQTL
jgi:hypothetical protein